MQASGRDRYWIGGWVHDGPLLDRRSPGGR